VEPWEHPQQPNEPEFPPKVEPRDNESCSPSPHLLSIEEPLEDSTDVSLGTTLDLAQAQGKLARPDASQMKGKILASVISFLEICWLSLLFY
jgi:hypothetical protein